MENMRRRRPWLIVGRTDPSADLAWERDGKRREMGLGSTSAVSLDKRPQQASTHGSKLADGKDPIVERGCRHRSRSYHPACRSAALWYIRR